MVNGKNQIGVTTVKRRRGRALAERAVLATALCATLALSSGGLALADAVATGGAGGAASGPATSGGGTPSSGGASATSGSGAAPGTLPAAPAALNPSRNLASFVMPINGVGGSQLSSSSSVDAAAAAAAVLEQRTYFSALQQWEAQGATPMPASVQVNVDPTKYSAAPVDTSQAGAEGVKILPTGTLDGNTSPALSWPVSVNYVDFPVHVPQTGLYQLQVTYRNYPTCFTPGQTAVNTANITGVLCGRGSSAERGVLIDPPGTVPQVQQETQAITPADQAILAAAKASGLNVANLPAWLNPEKTQVHIQPAPAWALMPLAPAKSTSSTSSSSAAAPPAASSSATSSSATSSTGTPATTSSTAPAATTAPPVSAAPPAGSTPTTPPTPACALNLTDGTGNPTGYDGYEFVEAHQVPFTNMWQEPKVSVDPKTGYVSFQKDNRGDDLYPIAVETEGWQTTNAQDAISAYRDPLLFCLPAGDHVLRLQMVREPMAIESISFHGVAAVPTYDQAEAAWKAQGMQPVTCGMCVKVQGENISAMSDFTIRPGSDSYPSIEPATHGYQILNELDGSFFQQPNEWVEYSITVPQTGLYKMGFKELQAGLQGLPASREITIDGQLPFDGAQWISVPFKNAWNVITLSQPDGQPALIGLTKGTHTVRMRVTLGIEGQTLSVIQQAAQRLGELQREILMITGPSPDPAVDYNLDKNVPDLIPQMQAVVSTLRQQAAILTYAAGGTPPVAANSINITANDIDLLSQHPNEIQLNLTRWGNDETSLSQWIFLLEQQPVSLDWFALTSPDYKLPSPSASPLQTLKVTWQTFVLSFYRDYTGVGSEYSDAINVWVGFGQLWAALMSQMAANEFTKQTGIHVNFNVVPGGAGIVLLAQVSGHGPDVATGMPATTPVDFALRGGAYDMTQFPGWDTVNKQFVPDATLPYQYTDPSGHTGIYGVPETQGMTMLFYRSDILNTLNNGLKVPIPTTWPELYQILPMVESKGMEFFYGQGPGGLTPFLYQHGGEYYKSDAAHGNLVSALDSDQGYAAVKEWTDLYNEWKVPLQANFFTRFQTGEMPIGIADYNTYVQIQASAPQLAGLWGIAPIPGEPYQCDASGCVLSTSAATPQPRCMYPDGDLSSMPALPPGMTCKINYTSGGDSSAVIIPKSSKHAQEAWQFIQWWTSASAQLEFANDILAIAGVQAAWNTANVEALAGLPWPEQDLQTFQKIWKAYKPVPIVPGGYVSDRYINNVWTNVVINSQNARAQLQWATQNIDDELYRQEVQFGLVKSQPGHIVAGA